MKEENIKKIDVEKIISNKSIHEGEKEIKILFNDKISAIDKTDRKYTKEIMNVINEETDGKEKNINGEYTLNIDIFNFIKNFINDKINSKKRINFLFGNGISLFSGSKTINTAEFKNWYDELENETSEHECQNNCDEIVQKYLNNIFSDLDIKNNIELLFNKVKELLMFLKNFDNNCWKNYDSIFFSNSNSLLKKWLNNSIGQIDYERNYFIWLFLNKIYHMTSKENSIFTLNYDLLVEKTADQANIFLTNGFTGIISKRFNLSEFNVVKYLEDKGIESRKLKKIKLIKLHGSISWHNTYDENQIIEKEPTFKNNKIADFNNYINEDLKVIFSNKQKTNLTLNNPFSDLFRILDSELIHENGLLIIFGYSGGDEHVNSLILKALNNPNFELLIFVYGVSDMFKEFEDQINKNMNITIIYSRIFSDFNFFSDEVLVNINAPNKYEQFAESFKKIVGDVK